jgi:hypothetical protein
MLKKNMLKVLNKPTVTNNKPAIKDKNENQQETDQG